MLPAYVVEIIRPGRLSYTEGLRLQERLVRGVQAGRRPEALVLLEHAPVITLGRGAHPEHLLCSPAELAARGLELHESARGGDITYHGPGQLVGYPVLDLNRRGRDLHAYIRSLEELLIRALAELGIRAVRRDGLTGVWVPADSRGPARKIAAIGIRVQRWVTSHGFAERGPGSGRVRADRPLRPARRGRDVHRAGDRAVLAARAGDRRGGGVLRRGVPDAAASRRTGLRDARRSLKSADETRPSGADLLHHLVRDVEVGVDVLHVVVILQLIHQPST